MEYNILNIAIYLRLSKEENKKEESNSIKNQRNLLLQFIQGQQEFTNYRILEFSDDGYSGIHFTRPAVQQLLEQVRIGKIDCIIVKDFSRFSRDYIELGSYLEQIFPFFGVRFISLNDGYDSAKEQGIGMDLVCTFQTFFYDWYSKDLSMKIKSSLKTKKEKGQYSSPYLPYGYQKDSIENHSIKICREEAEVVQMIFSFALNGKTLYEIAKFLNQKKIPTRTKTALWNTSTINQILKNTFYIGEMLYDKYKTEKVGDKSFLKAREEWKCIPNHHKPIIEKEVFEKVQNLTRRKKEKDFSKQNRKPYQKKIVKSSLFVGKLICGVCQKKLQIRDTKNPYFICTTSYLTDSSCCVKRLEVESIGQIVQQSIQKVLVFHQLLKEIEDIKSHYFEQRERKLQENIRQIRIEQEQINKKKAIEYKKCVFQDREKEKYLTWKEQIKSREKKLEKLQIRYEKEIAFLKRKKEKDEWIVILELEELLVKKIFVFNQKNLIINWNFPLPNSKKDS